MNEPGGDVVRKIIQTTVDSVDVEHFEPMPSVCRLRLESHHDYDALRELLEDEMMDGPSGFSLFYVSPFRHVLGDDADE